MSRRLVVFASLVGSLPRIKTAPGFASDRERDAIADALLGRRRKARAELEAVRQAGYRAWDIHHGQQGEAS